MDREDYRRIMTQLRNLKMSKYTNLSVNGPELVPRAVTITQPNKPHADDYLSQRAPSTAKG